MDVLLTHAPPRGVGDREDPPHQGFEALNWLAGRLQPPLLLHGHIHPDDEPTRVHRLGPYRSCATWSGAICWTSSRAPARGDPPRARHAS